MKIYFVRHGETTYNARDVYQPLDSPLSELGIRQAEFVGKRFKHISIDIILSSPLFRTQQTTEIINKTINKSVEWVKELVEIRRPSEFIDKNGAYEEVKNAKLLMKENKDNPSWHYSDEENFFDLRDRAVKFVDSLNNRKEKHILAVTHGEIMRTIMGVMLFGEKVSHEEHEKLQRFLKNTNTGITVCEKENSRWRLLTWNDHAHLR